MGRIRSSRKSIAEVLHAAGHGNGGGNGDQPAGGAERVAGRAVGRDGGSRGAAALRHLDRAGPEADCDEAPVGSTPNGRDMAGALVDSELLPGAGLGAFLAIADDLDRVSLRAGDRLFERGDVADHLFVLVSGQVVVTLHTEHGEQELAQLQPGAVVGEIGLLAGDRRSATVAAQTASDLIAVRGSAVRRLLSQHPHEAEELARRATLRLRRSQLIEHFTNLLGGLDEEIRDSIELLMEWVTVPAGACLFAEGDVGDAAYLVAAGRLRAYRRQDGGVEAEVGEIGRAELVGEMSLIDGEPRNASVYAVRDCQLMRFSRDAYEKLLERHPHVAFQLTQMALRRTLTPPSVQRQVERNRQLSFVLVPASPGIDLKELGARLAAALDGEVLCVTSDLLDEDLGREGVAQVHDDDVGALRLAYRMEELEQRYRYLVLLIDESWTPWSRRALRWADHVLLVGDATADPATGPLERELWSLLARQHHPKASLALLHPADTRLPSGTKAWLDVRTLQSHHHLRAGSDADVERLARRLSGKATSLVLGGGGARGFAHLGALQVLEDRNEPIDMIGGTSIGSIMAIGPAMGWPTAHARRVAVEAFRHLFDYTLPRTSILRGRRITAKLQDLIGDVDIADLWIPYFCVSTNLTHARAEYHDRGPLLLVARASIAIPGVLPPVPLDGDLLVDGGVLDNVPVEEMRRRNPTGRIIAVDVAPVEGPVAGSDYGLSVSGFGRRRRRDRSAGPPGLLSTMVRSSLLASVRDRQRVVREDIADLYLDVGVEGGGMLDFSTGERIADEGAESMRPVIERWLTSAADSDERTATGGYVRTAPPRRAVIDPGTRRRRGGVLLLTWRDLQHRMGRFGAVGVGVSVVLTLLFLMTGLTEQFHREPRETVDAIGADGWLLRGGASGAFTSGATMPAATAEEVVGAGASPLVVARHSITGTGAPLDVVIVGYVDGRPGAPGIVTGRAPGAPDEVVVDESSGLSVGDRAGIGEETYVVSGRSEATTLFAGMPLVFMDITAAQSLLYRGQDLASAVLLDGPPDAIPDGFTVMEPTEIAEDAMRPLERSISSVNLIRVLLWCVAAMIIGTMTYLSALERRRDVAVLKAVGASTVQLGTSIALQGVLVALVAAVIATGLQLLVVPVFPLAVTVPSRAYWQVPTIAVVVSLVAGAIGLRKAVRVDPALAFAGQGS